MAESSTTWRMTNISKSTRPCPICGKQDYCFFRQHIVDGNYEFFCHRTTSESDVVGVDGNLYYFKRFSEGANAKVFETDEDRKLRGYNGSIRANLGQVTRPNFQVVDEGPLEGEVPVASVELRDRFNRSLVSMMRLSRKHEASLREDWNTPNTPDLFERVTKVYPVFSVAPNDYIVSRYGYEGDKTLPRRGDVAKAMADTFWDVSSFPGFVTNLKGEPTIVGQEGIWFPVYNKDGKLISWRVRCDYPDKKGFLSDGREGVFSHSYNKNGKELTLFYPSESETHKPEEVSILWSSVKGKTQNKYKNLCGVFEKREEGKRYNGYGVGCKVGSLLSLYTQPSDNMSIVFLTEGEKKAMVANILSGYPCISIPGVNSFMKLFQKEDDGESMMDNLKRRGCRLAVVCYDADKSQNESVLSAQNGLAKALADCQMQVAIGEWNEHWGKGLDDIFVRGLKPTICPVKL